MQVKKTTLSVALAFGFCSSFAYAQVPANDLPTIRIDKNGNAVPIRSAKEEIQIKLPTERDKVNQALGQIKSRALTPQDIRDLKTLKMDIERAQATPYPSTAKPVTRTIPINLDSGVEPPVLRLSQGMQTSIVFSDMNGSPWNIDHVSYNQSMFSDDSVQSEGSDDSAGTNIISLSPKQPAAYGNVSIKLRGLSTPIMFVLTTGQKAVDFRIDAKVAGNNPDSQYQTSVYRSYPSIDEALTSFLDGVVPEEAKELKIEEARGSRAWTYQNNLYVKTKGTIAYPAYMASAKSTNGSNIYRFNGVKSNVTIMQNGQIFTAYLKTR